MKKQILAALITAATMGSASAAVVFSDNFDSYAPIVAANNGVYGTQTGGTLAGDVGGGWQVIGSVDFVLAPNYGGISGISMDNAGTPLAGTDGIIASIATTLGNTYTLTFKYSRNDQGGNQTSTTDLVLGSFGTTITVSGAVTPFSSTSFPGVTINGTGGNVALSFLSPASNLTYGVTIDDVVVTENVAAIPEPGEWAMMLSGLAVVGAIARRRRVRA
jgi:hypothetical protein